MDTKIFLQEFNSKASSNTSEGLNVQFKGRRKLLPLNDVAEVVSQYDQYREEREKCNIIRLTCQVNPICSNVLHNGITEIVRNEGSSGVTFINYGVYGTNERGEPYERNQQELFNGVVYKPNFEGSNPQPMEFWSSGHMNYQGFDQSRNIDSINTIFYAITNNNNELEGNRELAENEGYFHPTNAIRDTQLTNTTSGFIYHCGFDIFNNHLLRSNTFKTVCRLPETNREYVYNAYTSDYHGFNTIADVMRDVRGDKVIEKISFPTTAPVDNHARLVALHLYEYDDLDTFSGCIETKRINNYNGWVGFENKSKIKSYLDFRGNAEMDIERPIMYMNGGDFVDMYPSRELYSFVPIFNNHRQRIEKNWNYCLTYPSSSYTPFNLEEPFSEVIEPSNGINSLKAVYYDESIRGDNGTSQLVIYSVSKHGLQVGDHVNVYNTYTTFQFWVVDTNGERISEIYNTEQEASDELERIRIEGQISFDCGEDILVSADRVVSSETEVTFTELVINDAEVTNVADEYIFTIFNSNAQISNQWILLSRKQLRGLEPLVLADGRKLSIDDETRQFMRDENNRIYYIVNDSYVNVDLNAQNISYKRVVNGIECEYYIRIFDKLPNFKFASGDTSTEYELYKDNERMIREYQRREYDFENHISRLAFAQNIYSDEIGEIVFTDDIDISNLHNNLGRPLTDIYLTFIKNNKGYKEWYGYDYLDRNWQTTDIGLDGVEFSHAFGPVTYGIETSYESNYGTVINCINRITNVGNEINTPSGFTVDGYLNDVNEGQFRHYNTEDGRTINVGHNEIWYDTDTRFYGDLCCYDVYNAIERPISNVMHRFNTAQRESSISQSSFNDEDAPHYFRHFTYDEIGYDDYDSSEEYTITSHKYERRCDNKGEGYYYNPHYRIPIKALGKLNSIMPDFLTIREITYITDNIYVFTTLQNHFLSVGDKAILHDRRNDRYYTLITISGETDSYRTFRCMAFDYETDRMALNIADGQISGRDVYDFILFKMDNLGCPNYARVLRDGTYRIIWRDVINNGVDENNNGGIEVYPFTNGAFYINRRVDIYVRRQDPYGYYGLRSEDDIFGAERNIDEENNYARLDEIQC